MLHRERLSPSLLRNCGCFDDDINFYTRSFVLPKTRSQIFERRDGESFMKERLPKIRTWEPQNIPYPEYFDPLYKANLNYICYLNESDGDQGELLKIRPMRLTYHLDDETISLHEPHTENSGHLQGRMFYRQRVPRSDKRVINDFLSWRDFEIGKDVELFGRKYRMVSCDGFTKSFLEDRGIKVSSDEGIPIDAWNLKRHFGNRVAENEFEKEALKRTKVNEMNSWESLPSTLTFLVAWLDTTDDFHRSTRVKRTFRMLVSTSDDTITMTELTPGFNNALFLKGVRLPYTTSDGVRKFYRSVHMRPGMWIEVYKRPMFIYDCEGVSTRVYLKQQFGELDYGSCPIELLEKGPPPEQIEILPEELIFSATNKEFPHVKFLVVYDINVHRMDIYEMGKLREWAKGRPFLLDVDVSHLSEKNFHEGASIAIFKWTFILNEADSKTKKYLQSRESMNHE
uniref:DM10 domain-containing protein n=1 Tax=Acrobeloides nanus TaxID=290746 RepID=A0A914CDT3_9BILA